MIHEYADCLVVICDRCGADIETRMSCHREEFVEEHYCPGHAPACCDCGADLVGRTRHPADDQCPDAGDPEDWYRCTLCASRAYRSAYEARADTIPAPPPTTRDDVRLETTDAAPSTSAA